MNKHIGSDFDVFLEEEGLLIGAEAKVSERIAAYKLKKAEAHKQLAKARAARRTDCGTGKHR
ncbi:MAG: hypothetical protein ACR2GR_03195 [Rhodothermales bacterium]